MQWSSRCFEFVEFVGFGFWLFRLDLLLGLWVVGAGCCFGSVGFVACVGRGRGV